MASKKLICVLLLVVLCLSNFGSCKEIHDEVVEQQISKENENSESSSWAGWAKDKISEGLGLKSNDNDDSSVKHASDSTMDAAKNAKDKITGTASGTGQYVADKAGNLKNAAEEAKNRAYQTAEEAKNKAYETAKTAKEKAAEKSYSKAGKQKKSLFRR
ncbi:hypothetical protein H5410_063699 [Solanum commersonii]|uniref:Uncharacterized protein n=1 Tax=Solanum commersonii TaxID=4109 RepID=A0A9J5WEM0_SOLCO|nr:hypothetical protein H5410_063699 [Solanum commersonii]